MQVKESKTNWHFRISILKSAVRIGAGISLFLGRGLYVQSAGVLLILAEILGILEEL